MKILLNNKAQKAIASMDKPLKQRIRSAINGLTKLPPVGDIKPLQGVSDGSMRLRVGKYRIIYRKLIDISGEMVYIIDIGSRGDIYK